MLGTTTWWQTNQKTQSNTKCNRFLSCLEKYWKIWSRCVNWRDWKIEKRKNKTVLMKDEDCITRMRETQSESNWVKVRAMAMIADYELKLFTHKALGFSCWFFLKILPTRCRITNLIKTSKYLNTKKIFDGFSRIKGVL